MLSITTHVQTGGRKERLSGPPRVEDALLVVGKAVRAESSLGRNPRVLWLSANSIFIQVGKWCSKEREWQVKLRQETWISKPRSGAEKLKKSPYSLGLKLCQTLGLLHRMPFLGRKQLSER